MSASSILSGFVHQAGQNRHLQATAQGRDSVFTRSAYVLHLDGQFEHRVGLAFSQQITASLAAVKRVRLPRLGGTGHTMVIVVVVVMIWVRRKLRQIQRDVAQTRSPVGGRLVPVGCDLLK